MLLGRQSEEESSRSQTIWRMRLFGWYLILARKGVESWKIVYFTQMKPLGRLLTLSRQNKNRGNIYKKGKGGDRSTVS